MMSLAKTGCLFWPSWVSLQVLVQVTPEPTAFKLFLSGSFVVHSTCEAGIRVGEKIYCRWLVRWVVDILQLFEVAQWCVLGGIWTCS